MRLDALSRRAVLLAHDHGFRARMDYLRLKLEARVREAQFRINEEKRAAVWQLDPNERRTWAVDNVGVGHGNRPGRVTLDGPPEFLKTDEHP